MQIPSKAFSESSLKYRFGFNGKENDSEVKGEGNQQDYGMRIYDPRLGRFLSVDPITQEYPELTPYQFASNRPIDGVDKDGLEYTPAGRYGEKQLAVDATAVVLYSKNPALLQQDQEDAPKRRLLRAVAQAYCKPPAGVSSKEEPRTFLEKREHELQIQKLRDANGQDNDGNPKPLTKLAQNKTWNKFDENIATPLLLMAPLPSMGAIGKGSVGAVAKGVSVIGPRSTYREFAKKIGANFLNVTDEAWSMRKNVEFLQGVVKRGDDVMFAGKFNPEMLDPKSILAQEIRYLQGHGYSWTDDFSKLIKK
jgi:RHS repeat-associated protein